VAPLAGKWCDGVTATDTNVLVRLLTGDEPKQAAAARPLFTSEPIWIAKTVLLETGWVLRSLYGFEDSAIRDAFTKLLGLKNVHAEGESSVAAALALATHGIELADALHLSSRPADAAFVSFDKSFVQRARHAGVAGVSGMPVGLSLAKDALSIRKLRLFPFKVWVSTGSADLPERRTASFGRGSVKPILAFSVSEGIGFFFIGERPGDMSGISG
jgi:predicted nucleic-acid-binding protein